MAKKYKLSKKTQDLVNLTKVRARLLFSEFELKYELDCDKWYLILRYTAKGLDGYKSSESMNAFIYEGETTYNWRFNLRLRKALKRILEKIDEKYGIKENVSVVL